jgi:dsRNA-specific ribonuclease
MSMNLKNRKFTNSCEDDIYIEKGLNGLDTYFYDPYNSLNKEITPEDVKIILKTYGINIPINNFNLYRRAFAHRSYIRIPFNENLHKNVIFVPKPNDCLPLYTKSNERLEFIGDGILECITKYYLYRRFPKENEGFMTEKKIALVKNESIGRIAYEMGLHKWIILSKQSEEKQTRTNLKKLGCLFESFIGALFLDFNKMTIEDEDGMFGNLFVTGPGFQMVQIFIETIFEKHVDWIELIRNDDNYKNILQVKIQKEFKVTPHYMEIGQYNVVNGYHMGVYLCLGQPIYNANHINSIPISNFNNFNEIHEYMSIHGKILVFLGEGRHKIKKKAEQMASMANLSSYEF